MASSTQIRPNDSPHRLLRTGWQIGVFALVGFVASLFVLSMAGHFPDLGAIGVTLVMMAAVPLIGYAAVGLGQGIQALRIFGHKLTWWHWFWMLLAVSSLVFRPARDPSQLASTPIDAWAMLRLGPEAVVFGALVICLCFGKPNWTRGLFSGVVKWMALYAVVCIVTTLWSVSAAWTFYKSVEIFFDVGLLVAILASINSVDEYATLLNWTWLLYGIELLSAWVGSLVWPGAAWVEGRLEGVLPIVPYNAVGEIGVILVIIAVCRLFPIAGRGCDRASYAVLLTFGSISTIVAKTRNDLAGMLFGLLLILLFTRRYRATAVITIGSSAILLFTKAGAVVWSYLLREQTEAQLASLSSRMEWWQFAWKQFVQHPFTGLGAYAGSKFAVLNKLHLGGNGNIHSDYMEIMVGTGILGILPVIIALVATWWFLSRCVRDRAFSPKEQQLAMECIGVLGLLTVHSLFNVELIWHAPLLFLSILGYAEIVRRKLAVERAAHRERLSRLQTEIQPALAQV